jgi:mannose-6-phosphate isomerase-like protein (cupin superfamily)
VEADAVKPVERFRPETETLIEEGCHIVELHNSEMDEDCSIARARLEPGRTTRLHCLGTTVERYVILEGTGEVQLNRASPQRVNTLDVVNIPADVPQCITNTGHTDLIFLCICTPRFVAENYRDIGE